MIDLPDIAISLRRPETGGHGNERRSNVGKRHRSGWQISEEVMRKQHVSGLLAIPGGLSATQKCNGNPARIGKSGPTARQWVTGAVGKSLAVVIDVRARQKGGAK